MVSSISKLFKRVGSIKIGGVPVVYFVSPKKWMSWMRGNIIGFDLKEAYMEQYMFRRTNPGCKACVKKGNCIYCGCNTHKTMLDPKSACSGKDEHGYPFWGPMVSQKGWKDYKDLMGVEFIKVEKGLQYEDRG